jgi:hypothetical protein
MWFRIVLLVVLTAGSLLAQSSGLTLHAETEANRSQFQIGEAITLNLTFTRSETSLTGEWLVYLLGRDRSVLGFKSDRFIVSPESGTSDPWDYRRDQGILYSGPPGMYLRDKTTTVQLDLNQWVRFERPGHYRVHALLHAVGTEEVALESNEVAIEIVHADPTAQQEQLKKDIAILNAVPVKPDNDTFNMRMNAARRISYLDTPSSLRQSANLLGTMDVQVCQILRVGLLSSQHREIAAAAMKELFANPTQAVTPEFLNALANLEGAKGSAKQLDPNLAAVIEHKQGSARAISLKTLFNDLPAEPAPANLRAEMAALFSELPPGQQSELLYGQWTKIIGPEMIPALLQIRLPSTLAAIALERLNEIAPTQARTQILDEISRPVPHLSYRTLALLPDATLPELDHVFLQNLEKNNQTGELIARYATPAILEQVKIYYAKRDEMMRTRTSANVPNIASPACEPALVAYFLRVEPAFGQEQLQKSLSERGYPMGRCWMSILGHTASYYVSPAWEKMAIAALQDPTVVVKSDAVKALGQYGSPASRAAVLDSFRYWHEWWKDRPEMTQESRQFEKVLLDSTARGKNGATTEADFKLVRELCLTDGCRRQAQEYHGEWLARNH